MGYKTGGTVEHCVALNKEVLATNTTNNVGRVVGNNIGALTDNYARAEGMTLKNGSGDVTPTSDATGKDGLNAAAADTHQGNSGTWWSGTAGFSTELWDFANDRLPHLKTTEGGAFSEEQEPAVE